MKMGIVRDDMWPCYILVLDWTSADQSLQITEKFYQEYKLVSGLFADMQDKLEALYEDGALKEDK